MLSGKMISTLGGALFALAFQAVPAMAAQHIQAYEIDGQPTFTGNGGPGSTISVQAILTSPSNTNDVIGSKNEFCIITGFSPQGDRLLWCSESLVFTGSGSLFTQGTVDETLLEAYQPQTIAVFAGAGRYAGKSGTETIQQVVFPNQFILNIQLN